MENLGSSPEQEPNTGVNMKRVEAFLLGEIATQMMESSHMRPQSIEESNNPPLRRRNARREAFPRFTERMVQAAEAEGVGDNRTNEEKDLDEIRNAAAMMGVVDPGAEGELTKELFGSPFGGLHGLGPMPEIHSEVFARKID